jgi:hypothetical protein
VTCIVSDGFMPFAIKAAEELGVPVVVSFTLSACGVMACKQVRALMEKGLIPLKGSWQLKLLYNNKIMCFRVGYRSLTSISWVLHR